MEDRELSLFLRWLLKHYSTEIVYNGMFTYVDSLGREVDIESIIDHYKSEQLPQQEISDEEIEKFADEELGTIRTDFDFGVIQGMKWYREQLKNNVNGK